MRETAFLKSYVPLNELASQYDAITEVSMPDQTARVAKKEALIAEMAAFIGSTIPLHLARYADLPGMRAGFSRALGDAGLPSQYTFVALRSFTNLAGPTDWNLKHQIVRAYRVLHARFPTNTDIAVQAKTDLPHLLDNADARLKAMIADMKTELGITP